MKEKKGDPRLFDHICYRILAKKYKHLQQKVDQWLVLAAILRSKFHLSLKYRQRKVDLKASEKSFVFATKRHRKFHLYTQLSYTNISYLSKNTHLQKDAAFIKYDTSVKRKHAKTNENMIFSALFTNFRKTKILIFIK